MPALQFSSAHQPSHKLTHAESGFLFIWALIHLPLKSMGDFPLISMENRSGPYTIAHSISEHWDFLENA